MRECRWALARVKSVFRFFRRSPLVGDGARMQPITCSCHCESAEDNARRNSCVVQNTPQKAHWLPVMHGRSNFDSEIALWTSCKKQWLKRWRRTTIQSCAYKTSKEGTNIIKWICSFCKASPPQKLPPQRWRPVVKCTLQSTVGDSQGLFGAQWRRE